MIYYREDIETKPLVSIVICTYNRESLIRKAIDSVLNQKIDFLIEILIGDDASTDGTRDILLNYQKRYPNIFTLLFHEKNQGTGSNWAQVVKLVNGKYIALCDDDDYWHYEYKLQKQVEVLESNNSIGLVHTNYRKYFINKEKYKEIRIKNSKTKELIFSLFDGEYTIFTSSVVFRNSLIEKYVILDDYIKYRFPIQDWITWMLIAKYTQFYHLNISTFTYCLSTNSVTRSLNYEKLVDRYENEQIMYKYICNKFPDELNYDAKRWSKYVNYIFLVFAYNTKDFKKANYYGKKINKFSLRVFCSKNILLFNIYVLLKKKTKIFFELSEVL